MAKIKLKNLSVNVFGGAAQYGNQSTYHGTIITDASGNVKNNVSSTAATIGIGDEVQMAYLPAGLRLDDALLVVSVGMTATTTGSLGFKYVDGVDSTAVPEDAAYFGAGLALAAAARVRATGAKAPVVLPKDAYLTLTTAVAANVKASQVDAIVFGERVAS